MGSEMCIRDSIFGSVIVAIMFLAVFVGGANAGDCTRSQSAEAFAAKATTEPDPAEGLNCYR